MPAPYELWQTRKSLGVIRGFKPVYQYWGQWFTMNYFSEQEWIDFETIPVPQRLLAPFVMPMAQGKPIWEARQSAYRFKPAYVKLDDAVTDMDGLLMRVGADLSILDGDNMDPMMRIEAIKVAIAQAHVDAIERTHEYMRSKAIADGKITIKGDDYPEVLVDFQRRADFTDVLAGGNRWGDSGVSIFDYVQKWGDAMGEDERGGAPVRITMGSNPWKIARKDQEFLSHLDTNIRNPTAEIQRGLVSFDKIFKVGEMQVGGASGTRIELWVNNETYVDPVTKVATRYVGSNDIVITGSAEAVMGVNCYGRIIDKKAQFKPIPIFPSNYEQQVADLTVERIAHKSAPLFVPINPNATFKGTVTNL